VPCPFETPKQVFSKRKNGKKKHCTKIGQVLRLEKQNTMKKRLLREEAVKPLLFGRRRNWWDKVFWKECRDEEKKKKKGMLLEVSWSVRLYNLNIVHLWHIIINKLVNCMNYNVVYFTFWSTVSAVLCY